MVVTGKEQIRQWSVMVTGITFRDGGGQWWSLLVVREVVMVYDNLLLVVSMVRGGSGQWLSLVMNRLDSGQ